MKVDIIKTISVGGKVVRKGSDEAKGYDVADDGEAKALIALGYAKEVKAKEQAPENKAKAGAPENKGK